MLREPRAVLFDLDDTLYPLRGFVLSGFRAVTRRLATEYGVDAAQAYGVLARASYGAWRGYELQVLVRVFGLSSAIVPSLVDVIRRHEPDIGLPAQSARALRLLRPGWRLGVVTNGFPDIQERKIRALGLDRALDTVVYATEHGDRGGKPDREPFLEATRRLGVAPDRTVFVGDDMRCDLFGAAAVGMRTVLLARWGTRAGRRVPGGADAEADTLLEVPPAAERLVGAEGRLHVA